MLQKYFFNTQLAASLILLLMVEKSILRLLRAHGRFYSAIADRAKTVGNMATHTHNSAGSILYLHSVTPRSIGARAARILYLYRTNRHNCSFVIEAT